MTNQDKKTDEQTIEDFGRQWTEYTENDDYYGSVACLQDIFGPVLNLRKVADAQVADIGSGTGRIVNMLLDAGARHVTAIEPSMAMDALVENTKERANCVDYIRATGEAVSRCQQLDLVFSIGVLHHIVDPGPIVREAQKALKPGGHMLVWLYGKEGNEAYLTIFGPLRAITKRLPHFLLSFLCTILNAGSDVYILLCRCLPMPLRRYFLEHLAKLNRHQRHLTIYDQLNPAYAKYYTESEARSLFEDNGFIDVRHYHRHGYSWTVIGQKPQN